MLQNKTWQEKISKNSTLILDRFRTVHNIFNNNDLAGYLGVSHSTISGWKSRESIDYKLLFSKLDRNVNIDWVLTGDGEMFKNSTHKTREKNEVHTLDHSIPVISLTTNVNEIVDLLEKKSSTSESIKIPKQIAKDGAIAVQIEGDSMSPTINNGDIALCTKVANINEFTSDVLYLFFTYKGNSAFIKRFSHQENNNISFSSDNLNYKPLMIETENIALVLQVRGVLSTSLPTPHSSKLTKYETKIEFLETKLEQSQSENIQLLKKLANLA